MESDLELAVRLAREAGAAIEAVRARGFVARDKADHSPVTEADLASDRLIRQGLERARPDDAILSEESLGATPRPDQPLWCVDPLDGTEAFVDAAAQGDYVRGYAVQIAKLVPVGAHYDLVLGVTYEPRLDELLFAVRGEGTFGIFAGERRGPLHVSSRNTAFRQGGEADPANADRPWLLTSKRVDQTVRRGFFARGFRDAGTMRSVGVKVGRMVLGDADVYPATHGLSWWDLAAPQLILEEAGGRVTDRFDERPTYPLDRVAYPELDGPLVFTNGVTHDVAVELLSSGPT